MVTKEDMIYDAVLGLQDGQGKLMKCMTSQKVETATIKTQQNELIKGFDEHRKDKDIHFNPYYSETTWERLKRKKTEVVTGGSLGTVITGVILALCKSKGWL